MKVLMLSVLIILLGLIFFQDIKKRAIHIILPILVFISSSWITSNKGLFNFTLVIQNVGFLFLTLSILFLYMSIKNKMILNPFQNHFGWGDVLFYVSVSPLFVLRNYILFFIFSLIFALIMFLSFKRKMIENTIPLAGFASLLLAFFIVIEYFIQSTKITLL
jgi:hypothetical protein